MTPLVLMRSRIFKKIIARSLFLGKYFQRLPALLPVSPITANIKITGACNSRCITCNTWKAGHGKTIALHDLESLFSQMRRLGLENIRFTGGEPLLRDDIAECVRLAREYGFTRIAIQTNGLLLAEKAAALIDAGVSAIWVSVDGPGEINDRIRGVPGGFEKVRDGIIRVKQITRAENRVIETGIVSTILSLNIHQIPELTDLCRELDIVWALNLLDDHLYFFRKLDVAGLHVKDEGLIDAMIAHLTEAKKRTPEIISLTREDIIYCRDYLKGTGVEPPCVMAYLSVFVDEDLNVYPGCWVLPPLGNLNNSPLETIIRSRTYQDRAAAMFRRQCPGCTCGYTINLKHQNFDGLVDTGRLISRVLR